MLRRFPHGLNNFLVCLGSVVRNKMSGSENKPARNWLERYFPFVAKSPEMKIHWLEGAAMKGVLSREEITPYVRLLLAEHDTEQESYRKLFAQLSDEMQIFLLDAADIYDIPKLFRLLPCPGMEHAKVALVKSLPYYEKEKQLIRDRVFYAINDYSGELLEKVVRKLINEERAPEYFQENYERFQEIMEDEEFLLSLYPKSRGGQNW